MVFEYSKPSGGGGVVYTSGHGLPGAGPYFQRSMQTKVLDDLVYVDDVLTHGKTDPEFLTNTRRWRHGITSSHGESFSRFS